MELHDLLIDGESLDRSARPHRADERFKALWILLGVFTEDSEVVLQKLPDVAVEFCGIRMSSSPADGRIAS